MKYLLLTLICLLSIQLWGQRPRYYNFDTETSEVNGPHDFPTDAIADDFGPRDLGDGWHGGIDYNEYQGANLNQKWDLIVSPVSGIIQDANHLINDQASDYKYGLINVDSTYTLLFGHVFDDDHITYNEFDSSIILKKCEPPLDESWGLILNFSDTTYVYGQADGATVISGTDTFTTTNIIDDSAPFLPMGNSGGSYPVHLHLAMLPFDTEISSDNTNRNPCQYIDYDAPTYDISLWSELNGNGISVQYPGTASTKIAVRPSMQGESPGTKRYDVLMDVNTVSLHLNSMHSGSSQIIEGAEEEAIISLGARLGEDPVNHDIHYSYPGSIYQWEETGINSNTYNSDASGPNAMNPWDDYYFTDFIPRIHQDDVMGDGTTESAHCPMNTRYNDGSYEIKAEVIDVRDSSTTSDPVSFYIDNYKPFIQEVKITVDGSTVYRNYWECDPSCDGIQFTQEYVSNSVPYGAVFQISATASEPLSSLSLDIPPVGSIDPNDVSSDSMTWNYLVDLTSIPLNETIKMQYSGVDYSESGNSLLQFPPSARSGNCIQLPLRDSSQSWSNDQYTQGTDTLYDFTISCGQSELIGKIKTHNRGTSSSYEPTELELDNSNCLEGAVEATIVNTSGPMASDGSISLEVDMASVYPPLDYQWTSGENSSSIGNKVSGLYGVTITDSKCCTFEKMYYIDVDCPDYLVTGAYTQNACMNSEDGWIQLDTAQGMLPYSVEWSTGDQGMLLKDIPGGQYHFTVTDNVGCTQESFVFLDEKSMQINAQVDNPCSSTESNGSIELNVSGLGEWPYTYEWDDGNTSKDRYGLAGGYYRVTVTDEDGCSVDTSFQLNPGLQVYVADYNNIAFCREGEGCTGSIDVEVESVHGELSYTWSGPNNYSNNTQDINSLCEGDYNLTVRDGSGCTATLTRRICCCNYMDPGDEQYSFCGVPEESNSIKLSTDVNPSIHGNNGSIDLFVSGGTYSDYEYIWKDENGRFVSDRQDINALSPGEYCVTVTNGCQTYSICDTVTTLPCDASVLDNNDLVDIFLDSINHPCGLSSNGSILLEIPNPKMDSVIITLSDDTLIANYGVNPVEVDVQRLPAGTFYFNILVDTCLYNVGIKLTELNTTHFSHYDQDTCFFDDICQGEIINTYKTPADYVLAEGTGGIFKDCEVPIECNGMEVDVKSYSKETVQAAEYLQRLNAAMNVLGASYYQVLLGNFYSKNVGPCHYIRYCPTNFEITFTRPPFLGGFFPVPTPSSGTVHYIPNSNCWSVDCDWPTPDYDFCIDNDAVIGPENGINIEDQCITRVRTRAIGAKLAAEAGYFQQEYGNFEGSQLDNFIESNSHRQEFNCAIVEYCLDDFDLFYSNINEIFCQPLSADCIKKYFSYEFYLDNPNLSSCDIVYEDEIGLTVICQNAFNCEYNPPKMAYFSKTGYGNWGFSENEYNIDTIVKVFLDTIHAEQYNGLGLVKNFGRMIPWPILKNDGESVVYKYDHGGEIIDKERSDNISAYRSDFLAGTTIKSVKQTDTLEILLYEDSIYTHAMPIAADDSIEVSSIEYFSESETLRVVGTFKGNLYFDNTVLDYASTSQYYFMQFDKNGNVLSFQSVSNNVITDFEIDQVSHYSNRGLTFSTTVDGNDLELIDTVLSFAANDQGLCIVRLDSTLAFDDVKYLELDGSVDLIDFDIDSLATEYRLILQTDDNLYDGDSTIYINTEQYILIEGVMDDETQWHIPFDTTNIRKNSLNTVQNVFGNTYLSCSFKHQISIDNNSYSSSGGEDILLLRFDTTGHLMETGEFQYGSSYSEYLSEIMYDKGILYFAGKMEGDIERRGMGYHNFLSITEDRYFLSYITDDVETGESQSAKLQQEDKDSEQNNKLDCTVFPNPFSDRIAIECQAVDEGEAEVLIFDVSGKKVYSTELELSKGKNTRTLNGVSGLSSGLYFIELTTPKGKEFHAKIVK